MKHHSSRVGECLVCGKTRTVDDHPILSRLWAGKRTMSICYSCHDAVERLDMLTNWPGMVHGLFQVWDVVGQEGRIFLLKTAKLCVEALKQIHEGQGSTSLFLSGDVVAKTADKLGMEVDGGWTVTLTQAAWVVTPSQWLATATLTQR